MNLSRDALSLTRFRRIFYVVTPNETSFQDIKDVPDYLNEGVPWFMFLIALEFIYSVYKKKDLYRVNDAVTNINSGMLQTSMKLLFHTLEFTMACDIYEKYGWHFLRWDSIWTWIIAFMMCDLSYYWFHRMAHEVNFFWAFHQMHHSSEDYNLSTALRQGMFQPYLAILYNLPEAFFLPPAVHMAHMALNKLNQFWVHTQLIKTLGPLEHILVTPSHHRVHHGRNRYCIDKNYSGTLIIWDKLFGTFAAEKSDEPVVYGLVHNANTFDALELQLSHFKYIFFEKIPSMKTISDKVKAVVYGPGWFPGTPRLGNLSDIPEVESPVVKYDVKSPKWLLLYCVMQLNFTNLAVMYLLKHRDDMMFFEAIFYVIIITVSVQCCSGFLENKSWTPYLETVRCAIFYYLFFDKIWPLNKPFNVYANAFLGGATLFWLVKTLPDFSHGKMKIH